MRASLVLKEEFPKSAAFIKPEPGSDRYIFVAKVQSFQAPGSFVLGLPDEIEVIGSKEFIRYIDKLGNKKG